MPGANGELRVAVIGYGFMGRAHSHAWRSVAAFFDVPLRPRLSVICGRNAAAAQDVADRFGWDEVVRDWREVVARDDVDLIDVCTPGSSHAEISIAALEAGKHVLCEKPLANTVAEAEAMAAAADTARSSGARTLVGFNYRRVPALEYARRLVADGRLGDVRHVRGLYLQDWIRDPSFPLVWRLKAEEAGSGALGDICAHSLDIAQHVLGDRIIEVSAVLPRFISERPQEGDGIGLSATAAEGTAAVSVDDAALVLARFGGGAVATFEASRFATGHRNGMALELNGSGGSLAFDLERLNELSVYDDSDDALTQGFRRVVVTEPDHPWVGAWWPPGHVLGWEHTFTHQARDLLVDIAEGRDPAPSFADGLQLQRVLDAVQRAADSRRWETVAG